MRRNWIVVLSEWHSEHDSGDTVLGTKLVSVVPLMQLTIVFDFNSLYSCYEQSSRMLVFAPPALKKLAQSGFYLCFRKKLSHSKRLEKHKLSSVEFHSDWAIREYFKTSDKRLTYTQKARCMPPIFSKNIRANTFKSGLFKNNCKRDTTINTL